MATYKQYQCKHCGYTVEANPKGHDLTMAGEVYTYLCKECREIVADESNISKGTTRRRATRARSTAKKSTTKK